MTGPEGNNKLCVPSTVQHILRELCLFPSGPGNLGGVGGWGGTLPYMGYIGMCRSEGYGF